MDKARPKRRQAPRPLLLHLSVASQIYLSSLPASRLWRQGLLPWNNRLAARAEALRNRLNDLQARDNTDIPPSGSPDSVPTKFDLILAECAARQLNHYLAGIKRYWDTETAHSPSPVSDLALKAEHTIPLKHPTNPKLRRDPHKNHQNAKINQDTPSEITLLDYRPIAAAGLNATPRTQSRISPKPINKPILVIPSLINRAHILDLSEKNSFMRHLGENLSAQGFAPFLLDWGAPGPQECQYNLADYVKIPLSNALSTLSTWSRGDTEHQPPQPVTVIGYCMGGVLALALAVRNPHLIKNLVLLATPWDIHADEALRQRLTATLPWLKIMLGRWLKPGASLPVNVIQSLFFALDPMLSLRKFQALADETNLEKQRQFALVEDWVNDGTPLAGFVARECLLGWYGENQLAHRGWQIDGQVIDPTSFPRDWGGRCLAVIPHNDRIVPPDSALALAAILPNCKVLRPRLGHVSMMSAANAREVMWDDLANWIAATP